MVRNTLLLLVFCLSTIFFTISVQAESYFNYVAYGEKWYDADKSLSNTDDDLMCWAATASNMLAYSGWGFPASGNFNNEEDIFTYYQDHWTDNVGNIKYSLDWWFDGDVSPPSSWAQEDVDGGGFHLTENLYDYYEESYNKVAVLSTVDTYLHENRSVGLWLVGGQYNHLVTAWGYEYNESGDYLGVWITDSDDYSGSDQLSYYEVTFNTVTNQWDLDDNYGDFYIGGAYGLAKMPLQESIPEPATILLFATGLAGLVGRSYLRKN